MRACIAWSLNYYANRLLFAVLSRKDLRGRDVSKTQVLNRLLSHPGKRKKLPDTRTTHYSIASIAFIFVSYVQLDHESQYVSCADAFFNTMYCLARQRARMLWDTMTGDVIV